MVSGANSRYGNTDYSTTEIRLKLLCKPRHHWFLVIRYYLTKISGNIYGIT